MSGEHHLIIHLNGSFAFDRISQQMNRAVPIDVGRLIRSISSL